MCLSTALTSKTQENLALFSHIPLVSHCFFQFGGAVISSLSSFWSNEAAEQTNPHKTAPRQMLCYPSRQRQQKPDNSLYNAITSTFKAMLDYPMPHFSWAWNFQDARLYSSLGICPSCLMWSNGHCNYRGRQNHLRLERSPENPANWSNACLRTTACLPFFHYSPQCWKKTKPHKPQNQNTLTVWLKIQRELSEW